MRDLLLDYSRIYSEYLNIVVVSEKGQYLSNDSYRVKKLPLTEEKWYQDAVLANGELVLSPTSLGRNLKAWKNYSTDNYVSTVKLICDRQTSAGIGVILIDLDLKSIQNLVEDITMGQTGFGYIQDSQGHVLYAPQNEVVYRMNPNWVTDGESGRVRCRIKGKDYNVIYSHSKYTDLTAVGVFDWGGNYRRHFQSKDSFEMDCSYNNDLCGRSNGYFFGIHYKAYFDTFKTYEKSADRRYDGSFCKSL